MDVSILKRKSKFLIYQSFQHQISLRKILVSGFSLPKSEFFTPFRIINKNVCHGCWNNPNYNFDKGDWNWCPKLKGTDRQFECSKEITSQTVINNIKTLIKYE